MGSVKGSSPLRDQQAARTRAQILAAAAEVFVAQGFAGARIEDIATEAGVAVPTVYKAFTNKRNLLVGALDRALLGTDTDAPIDDQAWWLEQLDEPDPARQLQLVARNARRMYERAAPLLTVLQAAAPSDAELAGAWTDISAQRSQRSRRTAANLLGKLGPRARSSAKDTALTLLTLTDPALFAAHTAAGTSAERYERWLGDLLCRSLID